jgi:hypothetical protein
MNQYIEQAIDQFRSSATRYQKTERYYRGDHDLAFATEKFASTFGTLFREFAMNLCPAICDAVRDKLRIQGFGVNGISDAFTHYSARTNDVWGPSGAAKDEVVTPEGVIHTVRSDIDRIWFRNRMQQRAGEVHKEALKNGDAYAIVWFDPAGDVTIYPQHASHVTVTYDEDTPGRVLWAAKYWRTPDNRTRLNVFYPDRIERYVTKRETDGILPEARDFIAVSRSKSLVSGQDARDVRIETRDLGLETIVNPFGVVPVFHFANNSDVGCLGQSELAAAMPIQDGLNKSVLDMLVAMEYSAFRQRWVAGIEVEMDRETGEARSPFRSGAGQLWVATDPQTSFGDFNTSNLDQFLKVKDSFRVDMASVTGTPLHYFLQTSRGFASGEALKQNETRFLSKVRDRQTSFGQTWAELMSFALRLAGHGADIELITQWEDPSPVTERDILENLLLKKQLGVSTE